MRRLACVLLAAAGLLVPGTAGAATRCVPAPCAGDFQYATVSAAVAAADAADDPDVVRIGAGTFNLTEPAGAGFSQGITVARPSTELRGEGRGRTVLTLDAHLGEAYGYTIVSGRMGALSDLTLRLPTVRTTGNGSVTGADVAGATVRRVDVDAVGSTFGPGVNDGQGFGILLRSGSLDDVRIAFEPGTDTSGVRVLGSPRTTEISDLEVTAGGDYGLLVTMPRPAGGAVPELAVRRSRVSAPVPLQHAGGRMSLADAVLEARSQPGAAREDGIAVSAGYTDTPTVLTADRVTVSGTGQTDAAALRVGSGSATSPASVRGRHLLLAGFPVTLAETVGGSGATAVEVDHSLLSAGPDALRRTGATTGTVVHDLSRANRSGDPLLDAALVPRPGSPAIDVGGDDLLAGDGTDLAGAPRPLDGDGDGVAAADAGALEAPVPVPAQPAAPAPASGASPATTPVTPVTVAPADRTAPVLGGARLSATRFLVGTPRAPRGRRPARGARLRLTLSEAATLRITVRRAVPGRRAGRRCVAGRRSGRRCTRWVAAGSLPAAPLPAGLATVAITGRVGAAALRPGRYRLVLGATDAAGNAARAVTLPFRVLAPRAGPPVRR